jgi:hypothetical protein
MCLEQLPYPPVRGGSLYRPSSCWGHIGQLAPKDVDLKWIITVFSFLNAISSFFGLFFSFFVIMSPHLLVQLLV